MQFFRLLPLLGAAALFAQTARHPLTLDDLARMRDVRDPQCSPDGQWVAYAVGTTDAKEDKHDTDIWMVSFDGKQRPAAHLRPRRRERAALEPRRQVPVVHLFAARQGQGQPGVAARPRGRRGAAAHRHQGPPARLRVVARFQTAGAGDRRPRSRRTTPRRRPPRPSPKRPSPSSSIATTSSRMAPATCSPAATATSTCSTSRPRSWSA